MKELISYAEVKAPPEPKRRVRIKAQNAKRRGHRFPKNVNEPLRAFVRGLPCILTGQTDRQGRRHRCVTFTGAASDVCHLKPRSTGGPDDDNVFPACRAAHVEQEGHTKEFEYRWQLRLKAVCRKITAAFYAERGFR